MKKKILIIVLVVLVIIQFIRPARNISNEISANDITKLYHVPADVQQILKVACNDCHSNNTVYPWYTNIQPVGWWMQFHVDDGKAHLDFSSFGTYPPKRQHHKMEEVVEMVEKDEMPLKSYLWIHHNAKLTPDQKTRLINWAEQLKSEIAQKYNIVEER